MEKKTAVKKLRFRVRRTHDDGCDTRVRAIRFKFRTASSASGTLSTTLALLFSRVLPLVRPADADSAVSRAVLGFEQSGAAAKAGMPPLVRDGPVQPQHPFASCSVRRALFNATDQSRATLSLR